MGSSWQREAGRGATSIKQLSTDLWWTAADEAAGNNQLAGTITY